MSSYIYNLSTGPSPCGECFDGVQSVLTVCFVEVVPVGGVLGELVAQEFDAFAVGAAVQACELGIRVRDE